MRPQCGQTAGSLRQTHVAADVGVKDLVAGSNPGVEDRGFHALKGVPGAWRIHAVA
jgi:hypothetical protein